MFSVMNVCNGSGVKSNAENEVDTPRVYCSWDEVVSLTRLIAEQIKSEGNKYDIILGVTNGGIIPARLMARELNINYIQLIPIRDKRLYEREMPSLFREKKYLIIDEIYDTGGTFSKIYNAVKKFNCHFAFLISRCNNMNLFERSYLGKILSHSGWVIFPWE